MKNKIMWKDVTLIVLAILLIFSMCRIHTLKQSNKKLYSQNLELNHQLATLKEKNTGLESKLNSEESITDEKKSDNSQQISAPAGIFFSGVISARLPSASSAQSNIPSESTPASFAGFRFTRTITFLPTISSGV